MPDKDVPTNGPDADAPEPGEEREVVVVRVDDDEEPKGDTIEQPAKLVRIATMVQRMLNEVRDVDLDEASRKRLAEIYNRVVDELSEVLPGDLREELSAMVIHVVTAEDPPSQAELQLVHAQLVGWLEGLFHGIQASIASQQLALQEQLQRMRHQQALESGSQPGDKRAGGPYL